jgi:uncharacterized MAPEG superfamily protein
MTTELTYLAWTVVLALVQILLPAAARTVQYGTRWNTGPRDEGVPPPAKLAGRLDRAQRNLFETLPLFAAAVLIAHVAGKNCGWTAAGAALYFWPRVVYVPLYGLGVPYARSLVWVVSLVGLLLVLAAVLRPA